MYLSYMKYIITESQIEKILKKYFDGVFNDAEFKVHKMDSDDNWKGFVKDDVFLVGYPIDDNSFWYTNGQYFNPMWDMFGIDVREFNTYMGEYLENRYNIEINHIM